MGVGGRRVKISFEQLPSDDASGTASSALLACEEERLAEKVELHQRLKMGDRGSVTPGVFDLLFEVSRGNKDFMLRSKAWHCFLAARLTEPYKRIMIAESLIKISLRLTKIPPSDDFHASKRNAGADPSHAVEYGPSYPIPAHFEEDPVKKAKRLRLLRSNLP